MSDAFEKFRDALSNHGSTFAKTTQNHYMAQCPAHPDNNPSLGVDDKGDKIMVRCYAGCQTDDVLDVLGWTPADLFDSDPATTGGGRAAQATEALPIRHYVYESVQGEPWFIKDRYWPKTFRLRLPGTDPGDKRGIKGKPSILYRMPQLYRAMQAGVENIYLVDGEKDVETLEKLGAVATCPPGGAGAEWQEEFSHFLRSAKKVTIVVDQDPLKSNGELGAGQQFAARARAGLRSVGVQVRCVSPAIGKDTTEHVKGGYGLDDFVVETTVYTRPRGMKADALMQQEFEPVRYAVESILPAGLTIIAGSPKVGKSWVSLDLCLAVAAGGQALSALATTKGSSLYLAREDTYRRLQSRINLCMGGEAAPPALELIPSEHDWVGGPQGLSNLTDWAEEVGDPTLVVLDTLAKVEPEMGEDGRGNAYGGNYTMMARYKDWADQHNCAVVVIHHDRKSAASAKRDSTEDPFSRISGTRGLTGAADTMWFLESVRGEREGTLHVTGRDVVEQSITMEKLGPLWTLTDQPTQI